jgi:hypothetical protein
VREWVAQDDENIAVIHCKAGKGRTGVMICNWLMFSGEWNSPEDSMAYYAAMRTYNMKGVTIPSQIRYIHYFAKSLVRNELPVKRYRRARLKRIVLHTVPQLGGDPLYFEIFERDPTCQAQPIERRLIYRYVGDEASAAEVKARQKAQKQRLKDEPDAYGAAAAHLRENGVERLQFTLDAGGLVDWSTGSAAAPAALASSSGDGSKGMKEKPAIDETDVVETDATSVGLCYNAVPAQLATADADGLQFAGDVVVQFYEGKPGKSEKVFFFWINSHHVDERTFIEKKLVDKAHKDKKHAIFCANFHVELQFSSLEPLELLSSSSGSVGSGTAAAAAAAAAPSLERASSASVQRSKSPAADMLLSRRGYERESRPGTLEETETVLNAGGLPLSIDEFYKLNRDAIVDASPCALAAYLCECATEALERFAESDVVGGAALAAAASSSLPSSLSLSSGGVPPPTSSSSSSSSSSRLRMVGLSGLKQMTDAGALGRLVETARVLQHVKTVPALRHAERLSFWLNVYNALSVHANAVYQPSTLRERLHAQLYFKYQIGAEKYSMAEIQLFMLRNTLPTSPQLERLLRERIEWRNKKGPLPGALLTAEPAVTFCLNNGVPSAPEIVPFYPDNIEDQLKRAARRYFARLFRVDRREKCALLPRMLSWVRDDFGRDRAERLAMLGDFMDVDQRRALFECGKRANGIMYVYNDQTLGFACQPLKTSDLRRSSAVPASVVDASRADRSASTDRSVSGRPKKSSLTSSQVKTAKAPKAKFSATDDYAVPHQKPRSAKEDSSDSDADPHSDDEGDAAKKQSTKRK